jgi:membrane protease YdiL (CAAX protease family)
MPREEIPLPLLAVVALLICGSLVVWTRVVQRLVQRQPLIAYEPRRPVPWNGVDLAAVLCILVLAFCTVGYILVYFYHGGQMPKTPGFAELMANLGAELIAVELAILLLMRRAGATATDFGLSTARLGYDLRLGALGYLLVIVPITLLQAALSRIEAYHHPLIDAFRQRHDMLMIAGTTVAAIVVAPLCEELVFRVMLQGWFESLESARQASCEKSNPASGLEAAAGDVQSPEEAKPAAGVVWWPILLSSGLFALMHRDQGLAQIPLFFLALVLGYLYQRTHRLWPSLSVHMLLNAGTMAVLWLQTVGAA